MHAGPHANRMNACFLPPLLCRYVCLLCLLRASAARAALPASTDGFVCPYADKPIVQECPTATCTVTGLSAGKCQPADGAVCLGLSVAVADLPGWQCAVDRERLVHAASSSSVVMAECGGILPLHAVQASSTACRAMR